MKNPLTDPRFTAFNNSRDGGGYTAGCFGFSFKDGDLIADLQPVNEKTRKHVWGATLRRGNEEIATLGADDPWTLAGDLLATVAKER